MDPVIWKNSVNRMLRRVGYEVVRVRRAGPSPGSAAPMVGDRLLRGPVFVLSSVRSGSTLLRMILDSHSRLHAPHELHLRDLRVDLTSDYVAKAMAELGLEQRDLEHLLWDRVLHHELTRSGKAIHVNKSPDDVFMWRRIAACWRDARFVFLLRHPGDMVASWWRARPRYSEDEVVASILSYATAVQEARTELPGATVRYEDLLADPEAVIRDLCGFLGVEFEPEMLDYGRAEGRTFKAGLGDWSELIRSGRVQTATIAEHATIPGRLKKIARTWGYT
ncbi:MAG TPA: sulfotransferase [Streptosporangiaceae bacterium]